MKLYDSGWRLTNEGPCIEEIHLSKDGTIKSIYFRPPDEHGSPFDWTIPIGIDAEEYVQLCPPLRMKVVRKYLDWQVNDKELKMVSMGLQDEKELRFLSYYWATQKEGIKNESPQYIQFNHQQLIFKNDVSLGYMEWPSSKPIPPLELFSGYKPKIIQDFSKIYLSQEIKNELLEVVGVFPDARVSIGECLGNLENIIPANPRKISVYA